jgi:hypothetical protein
MDNPYTASLESSVLSDFERDLGLKISLQLILVGSSSMGISSVTLMLNPLFPSIFDFPEQGFIVLGSYLSGQGLKQGIDLGSMLRDTYRYLSIELYQRDSLIEEIKTRYNLTD